MQVVDGLVGKLREVTDSVLFSQQRVGLEERLFTLYKFRTMEIGRENEREILAETNGRDSFGYIVNDPRITPLGRYLRILWIDELPQLWNIVKRDMGLIGPRPLTQEVYNLLPEYLKEKRRKVRPGLMPVTYADYFSINSNDDRWGSEFNYLHQSEANPIKTKVKYFLKILNTMVKLSSSNLRRDVNKWTNSLPYS